MTTDCNRRPPKRPNPCIIGISILIVFSTVFLSPSVARGQVQASEYQVKAAYLFNFGKFVRWPARANNESFPICILGRDPFGAALDTIVNGENIDGTKLLTKRIETAQEATACRILFISTSEEDRLTSIISAVSKFPVLTVSDIPRFTGRGGMIQFVLQDGRIRFEVNLATAQSVGLTLSSQLLKVATVVKQNSKGGMD